MARRTLVSNPDEDEYALSLEHARATGFRVLHEARRVSPRQRFGALLS